MSEKPANKRRQRTSPASKTEWKRVDALRDEDLDTEDIPEPTPDQFARAVAREGLEPVQRKLQFTLRLDADVLDWVRAH